MSSQRSRPRGPNRSTEAGGHGEELHLWEDVKKLLPSALNALNDSSANVLAIRDQDKIMAEKKDKGSEFTTSLLFYVHSYTDDDNSKPLWWRTTAS